MHLLYHNFLAIIDKNRHSVSSWHWRGNAHIDVPEKIGNCPSPLQKIFKNIHNQYLQWHWENKPPLNTNKEKIYGAISLPHINTFDMPLETVTLNILGKKQTGILYEWLDDLSSDSGAGDYPLFKTYIFVAENDKNFCHLVVRTKDYFVPSTFGIDDFLLLYAHTRGIDGLYYSLVKGCEADFLYDKLLNLPLVFEDIDIDFCIEKFYEQHLNCVSKPEILPQNNASKNIKIKYENGNFTIYIDEKLVTFPTKKNLGLELLKDLSKGLGLAHFIDENTQKNWQTYTSIIEENVMLFSIQHLEKDLLALECVILSNPIKILFDFCDAISFYKAFLNCVEEAITKEKNPNTKNIWIWEHKKLKTMLRFLFLNEF